MAIDEPRALARGISLFPEHYAIIDQCARERRLRGNTFSPTVQFIIEEWRDLRAMAALLPEEVRHELEQRLAAQRTQSAQADLSR